MRVYRNHQIEKIATFFSLTKYEVSKLLLLADLEINLENNKDDFKLCYKLSLELKNKYVFDKAQKLIELGLTIFKNTIELNVLLANLKMLQKKYTEAIELNLELIKQIQPKKYKKIKKNIKKIKIAKRALYMYYLKKTKTNQTLDTITSKLNKLKNKKKKLFKNEKIKKKNLTIMKRDLNFILKSPVSLNDK